MPSVGVAVLVLAHAQKYSAVMDSDANGPQEL